jgi:ribosomal protein L12E/L44/L45/RPP1/RPP2
MFAPYQIRLDDGRLIFAPQDINEVIRAEGSALPLPPGTSAADFEHTGGEEEHDEGGEYDEEDEGEYEDEEDEVA